jgi:hypothetical protein
VTARIALLDWPRDVLPPLDDWFSVKIGLQYLEGVNITEASSTRSGWIPLQIQRIEGESSLLPIDVKMHVGRSDVD